MRADWPDALWLIPLVGLPMFLYGMWGLRRVGRIGAMWNVRLALVSLVTPLWFGALLFFGLLMLQAGNGRLFAMIIMLPPLLLVAAIPATAVYAATGSGGMALFGWLAGAIVPALFVVFLSIGAAVAGWHAVLFAAFFFWARPIGSRAARPPEPCAHCRYNLAGLPDGGVCPECGKAQEVESSNADATRAE